MEEMEFAGATSFYVLRHGETDANAAGIIQGSSDYSRLTDTGRSQALAFGMMALDPSTIKRIDQIFVSPLTRAQDTLKLIRESAPPGILPPSEIILPNLREIDMYSWENQKKDTLKQMYPNEFAAWRSADPDKVIVDGRLPLHETWSRAGEVWKEIRLQVSQSLLASTNDNVSNGSCTTVGEGSAKLLVCHGTLGQALLGSAFGMDATTFRRNVFPNCGMAEIVWNHNEDVAASWRWHNICDDGSDKTEEWRLGV
jgi:probable phosphoglycerate mutase